MDRATAAAASDLGVHRRLPASKSQQRSGSSSSDDSVHSKASTPTGKPALQSIVGNLAVPGEMRYGIGHTVGEQLQILPSHLSCAHVGPYRVLVPCVAACNRNILHVCNNQKCLAWWHGIVVYCSCFMPDGVLSNRWPYSEDVFELGPGEQRSFATDVHLPVLKGRLYLASMRTCPVARPLEYYLTLNKKLRYIPFCADFGELSRVS